MQQNDDDKKDDKKVAKISVTNPNTVERAAGFGSRSAVYEPRNAFLIPNKEQELQQVVAELEGIAGSEGNKDTSAVTELQTNQGEILKDVAKYLKENKDQRGVFEAVKTLFSKKDIKWTDQVNGIGLRLVRLFELQRTGTTDVMQFEEMQNVLAKYESRLLEKAPDADKAKFILKNVENSKAGTTELGLEDLLETRELVQQYLKNLLVGEYQKPADPQNLEGPQGDMKLVETDISPDIITFLRLYESLSIAVIKQREITKEKETGLDAKRVEVLNSLDRLGRCQGVVITQEVREKFQNKMSVMNMDQLKYLDLKILTLLNKVNRKQVDMAAANTEIMGWLNKQFTTQELHEELLEMKARNKAKADADMADIRNNNLKLAA